MGDGLDTVDHTNVFAHLESSLSNLKLDVSQAVLTDDFKEILTKFNRSSGNLHALSISMSGQVLQEITQVALIRVILSSP